MTRREAQTSEPEARWSLLVHPDDEARLARGAAPFDDLYAAHGGSTRH